MPTVRSLICVALNYYTPHDHVDDPAIAKISRYGWGRDYHRILHKKLKHFTRWLADQGEEIEARYYADTGPVQDKAWAQQAGLGWIAKNMDPLTPADEIELEPHLGPKRRGEQVLHLLHDGRNDNRAYLQFLDARKSKKLTGELAPPFCGLTGHFGPSLDLGRSRIPGDQGHAPRQRLQQIVKVVRDSSGELADGLHLL